MYSVGSSPLSAQQTKKSTSFQYILVFFCLILLVTLICGTIAVSLIPIYLSKTTVTQNSAAFTSRDVTMSIEVEQNHTVTTGRRRRLTGDLYDYIGGQFTSAGNDMLRSQLLPYMKGQNLIQDLIISNVSLGYKGDYKRKRFALDKRAVYYNHSVVMIVVFRVAFLPTCYHACQITRGSQIRNTFMALPASTFNLINVPMYVNQVLVVAPRIELVVVAYISFIVPSVDSTTQQVQTVTITLTSTAVTTPAATPAIG